MTPAEPLLYREAIRPPRRRRLLGALWVALWTALIGWTLLVDPRDPALVALRVLTYVAVLLVIPFGLGAVVTEVRPRRLRWRHRWMAWLPALHWKVAPEEVEHVHVSTYHRVVDGGPGGWGCREALHVHLVRKGRLANAPDFIVLPTRDPHGLCAALREAGFRVAPPPASGADGQAEVPSAGALATPSDA